MTPRFDPSQIPKSPDLSHERALWVNGVLWIAGIDEAGRGPLAGPVVVAAVVMPQIATYTQELEGVRDSKQMTPTQRESWSHIIRETAVTFGVGAASAQEIDAAGIVPATQLAATRALRALSVIPDHLLLDYLQLPNIAIPQTSLVKGDARSLSIAAASILAKTSRDAILIEMDERYPGYGFAAHKGYGTAAHLDAIERLGPCAVHRMTFAPLKTLERSNVFPGEDYG